MFQKLFQQFLQRFVKNMGRGPQNPAELMQIQDQAVRHLNKTKGAPSITKNIPGETKITIDEVLKGPVESGGPKGDRIWDLSQKKGEVIPFPDKGIRGLMQKGDVTVGTAPRTLPGTLKAKKDRGILLRDADEDILRIKRENKEAIDRFREKMNKDPDKFQYGGIAPLVGEPSYAADFYDDRVPMAGGSIVKGGKWFLNNLRKALNDIETNKGFKNLTSDRKEGLTSEIKNLIKSIEGGGPIPDEMVQTIRKDPKFAEISKTRSTDPDLYEFEDLILNYGKDDVNRMKDISQKIDLDEFDVTGQTKHAEGGRAGYIFGGSAGLKGMWKSILKHLNKGRDKPITKLFPKLSADERRMEKLVMGTPEQKAFREGEVTHKLEGIDILINRLKHDKKIIERQAKNKAMKDEGLDFLMKHLEETVMPDIYGPHLKKYTNIDKDILQMENIKKNLIMKDRKLNAYGGRIGYAGGGKAGLPAVTMGTPQMNMQQPQMPAGPQPAGIPGGTIVAQNQMQQSPWMGSQMQQGIGGMPQRGQPRPGGMPGPGAMPRPMAAEGGIMRMPFGLGSMSRRAFLKMMAAGATLPFIGKGISKMAPKAIKETTEVITRGAEGMPAYLTDLIEVVKAKGARDVIEGFKKSDYSTVHRYKGVEVIEEAGGNIRIKNTKQGSSTSEITGKSYEGPLQDIEMNIKKGDYVKNKQGKMVKAGDEYIEVTVRPDMDGKMKDMVEYVDEADHLDFKKIADELHEEGFYYPLDAGEKLKGKASGGLAAMLGE